MIFKTKNSTYEFGELDGLPAFRRVDGVNETLLPVPDGEWVKYREASLLSGRLYVEWGDGLLDKIVTSRGEFVDSD